MGVEVTGEEGEKESQIVRAGKCLKTSASAVAPAPPSAPFAAPGPAPQRDVEVFFPPRSPSSPFAPYRESSPQSDVEIFSPPRSPLSPLAPYREFSSLRRKPQQLHKRPQLQRRPVWWWFFG